jgi:hypothetical protein
VGHKNTHDTKPVGARLAREDIRPTTTKPPTQKGLVLTGLFRERGLPEKIAMSLMTTISGSPSSKSSRRKRVV